MPIDQDEVAVKHDCAWPDCGCCWDSMCAKEVNRRVDLATMKRAKGIKRGIDQERQDLARYAPTYEQGVAAGLEMAAKVAEEWDRRGSTIARHICEHIRALADQPSPAEEPKP